MLANQGFSKFQQRTILWALGSVFLCSCALLALFLEPTFSTFAAPLARTMSAPVNDSPLSLLFNTSRPIPSSPVSLLFEAQHERELAPADRTEPQSKSPISLLLEAQHELNSEIAVSRFPIDPTKAGSLFTWKASSQAPLLVHDPEHTGNITSASQLFGNWTFGDLRDSSDRDKPMWEDGYQALAVMDTNADGLISGRELEPLGLWFDDNRDGISQAGEVQELDHIGIVSLSYKPDYVDPDTGDIYVMNGFQQVRGQELVEGSSVDWFARVIE